MWQSSRLAPNGIIPDVNVGVFANVEDEVLDRDELIEWMESERGLCILRP